ncbi:restriction endonuclease subunit S [Bifidobacteriaceae bacterium NR044]|nr:restriction endonuclease subunit S [Bifidobacteriaceae bacterium NR043]MBF9353251.1 restriction endonuclease subunit S [Bifidobacteriaceae bacterium NR044]
MGLSRYKLGELIEQCDVRNDKLKYTLKDVKGISIQKIFIETKADMKDVSLNPYKLVQPDNFAYVTVTSRNGEKITLAHNTTVNTYIVSSSYIVFKVNRTDLLSSDFLYIYFNRPEFDRYSRFNSLGSARETFSWDDMCDMDIDLPPLAIQQKYVDVYNAMVANQKTYERGLEDLKLTCDAYIEDLRRQIPCEAIGPYIERHDVRNGQNGTKNVMGVSTTKEFREPTSKVNRNDLANYKVVKPRQISFVQTTHNEKVFCNALNNTDEDIVVTSVNEVFSTNENKLLPEYLVMFFNRTEFDRYARYHSWGSARETFTWDDLIKVQIPIADMEVQRSIVDIYTAYKQRRSINEKLKAQIKAICPILIKGSIEEGSNSKEA